MPSGAFIQKLNAQTVARDGTTVTFSGGQTLKAIIADGDHELLRGLSSDGDAPEKRPVVLVFAGSAWGTVLEDMKATIGAGAMVRDFRIAAPLHPKWNGDVVTELSVVAYPA